MTKHIKRVSAPRLRIVLAAGIAVAVAGCTVGPNFVPPTSETTSYDVAGAPPPAVPGSPVPAQRIALGQKVSGEWWRLMHSRRLDEVMRLAIAGNRDIEAARANLAEAQETLNQATAGLYPNIDASAGASRQKVNLAANTGLQLFPDTVFNLFSFGGTIDYALDVAGGTRRRIEEQQALAEYQNHQLHATYLTLTANAAAQAIEIASVRAQIAALEGIIKDDQQNLELTRNALRVGTVSEVDVQVSASQLAADRALLSPLRQQLSVARHALAILVGRAPGNWVPPDFDLAEFELPRELPLSLPSELVHQRPDILAAESQLHAASAFVGVATAQLYPRINLTASLTQAALTPANIFGDQENAWSFGAGLTAPIFHGGELEAQKRAAEAALTGARARYEQTVLLSFGQVADLLQGLGHDAQLVEDERTALGAAESSLRLIGLAYRAGNVNILQTLDAQRLRERAELSYIQAVAQRYRDTLQLFVAMGGGGFEALASNAPSPPSITR
jgi:NodT family efflux transporter outer membrane factor (OMF) lipoprotein